MTSTRTAYARRRQARAARRARRVLLVGLVVLAFLITVILAAFGSSPGNVTSPAPASASRLLPAGPPRPQVVALQGSLRIQLPIAQRSVTAIGYHAGGGDALPLEPLGRQGNEGLVSRFFHRIFGGGGGGLVWYQLPGGEGPATGALDVGAAPGTDVYAPADGAVVSLRDYVVNGKPYGHRIEIQPSGEPSVVVAVHHLQADPALTVGAPVTSGSSKIGTVLDFSAVERQALARHTQDAGNHVTLVVKPAARLALR